MICAMMNLLNEYNQLNLKQKELILRQQTFNQLCLDMFTRRDEIDMCNDFIEYETIYVQNESYIYYFDDTNQLICTKKT